MTSTPLAVCLSTTLTLSPAAGTLTYTYDPVGNRLSMTTTPGGGAPAVHTYGYDPLSQLTSVTGAQTHGYQYDAVGNRSLVDGVSYTPNPLNQYSAVGGVAYAYDANGNLTNDGVNTYTYDAENRLISTQQTANSTQYTYDAFGRRISKALNGVTTKFTYDGDQIVEELDGSGAQLAEYINGPGIDEPLRMQRGSVKTYLLPDGLGSITHLTDRNGAIVEQYRYDPYGKPTILDATGTILTQSAFGNRVLFTGREYDAETGTYHYRARTYNALLGRFHQRDPINLADVQLPSNHLATLRWLFRKRRLFSSLLPFSPTRGILKEILQTNPGLLNLYPYAGNNPINRVDPDGEISPLTLFWVTLLAILLANFGKFAIEELLQSAPLHVIKEKLIEIAPDLAEEEEELDELLKELDKLCPIP